jgi:positive regulator of sigma E activity
MADTGGELYALIQSVPTTSLDQSNRSESRVKAIIQPHTNCQGCGACSLFVREEDEQQTIELLTNIPVKAGDRVAYVHQAKGELLAALLIFGLPVLTFVSGIWLGTTQEIGEGHSLLIGLSFFLITFFLLRQLDQKGTFYWTLPMITRVDKSNNVE